MEDEAGLYQRIWGEAPASGADDESFVWPPADRASARRSTTTTPAQSGNAPGEAPYLPDAGEQRLSPVLAEALEDHRRLINRVGEMTARNGALVKELSESQGRLTGRLDRAESQLAEELDQRQWKTAESIRDLQDLFEERLSAVEAGVAQGLKTAVGLLAETMQKLRTELDESLANHQSEITERLHRLELAAGRQETTLGAQFHELSVGLTQTVHSLRSELETTVQAQHAELVIRLAILEAAPDKLRLSVKKLLEKAAAPPASAAPVPSAKTAAKTASARGKGPPPGRKSPAAKRSTRN